MICEIYKHSPVFRIGGDEFAVVLTGRDYEQRENLLQDLKNETMINKKSRTGPVVACGMADSDSAGTQTSARWNVRLFIDCIRRRICLFE